MDDATGLRAGALHENGHTFVLGHQVGLSGFMSNMRCCLDCGIIRNANGKNSQCQGAVRVSIRAAASIGKEGE